MEKEDAEQFQLLGALSIVREAFNSLLGSSRRKLVWTLALTLLLTLSFASLGAQNFNFGPLLFNNNEKKIEGVILPGEATLPELRSGWRELFVVVAPYTPFFFALLMLSKAAVVYTVASIYSTNNEKMKLCTDVPRIWKRLTLTFLWVFMISFGILAAIIFVYIIFFPADHKLRWGAFLFGAILLIVVFVCFQMYIITLSYLASVVSFLEDKDYCLGAGDFSKLKWMTALALLILIISGGLGAVLGRLFGYAIVEGRRHGVGIAATALYRTLLVGLLCFVAIMVLLTQSVLYFVCKSFHHESMDDNCSFKIHNVGDYKPLNTSSIQVEHICAEV